MNACFGITKKRRFCKRTPPNGKLFCEEHRLQPIKAAAAFVAAAVAAVAYSYIAGLLPLPWQEGILAGEDFRLKLVAGVHGTVLIRKKLTDDDLPQRIRAISHVSPILIQAELDRQGEATPLTPPTKNVWKFWVYYDKSPIVSGLNKLDKINELEGLTLKSRVSLWPFGLREGNLNQFVLYLYIPGRELKMELDETGTASTVITREML